MNYQVFLVGGAVRDQLLNLPVTERDWVVVGASPEDLLKQGYQQVGKHFPVFLHPKTKDEYALARIEKKTGHGYQGFSCEFSKYVTLEEDLQRRDLSINAMAMDRDGNIIDPYGGLQDIQKKILRHVSAAFIEDPLRVLRVARFAARLHHLGFVIAPETMALMQDITKSGELKYLSVERIWKEFELAFATQDPAIFIKTLKNCGALQMLAPMLSDLPLHALQSLDSNNSKHGLCIYLSPLNPDELNTFSEHFRLPKQLVHLIKGLQQAKEALLHPLDAKTALVTLEKLDAFRQKNYFYELLDCIKQTTSDTSTALMIELWSDIIESTACIKLPEDLKKSNDPQQIRAYFQQKRLEYIDAALKLLNLARQNGK